MSEFLKGFLWGVLSGIIANYLFDKYKIYKRGSKPFISTKTVGNQISFEGQITNSFTGQSAISNLVKRISPESESK